MKETIEKFGDHYSELVRFINSLSFDEKKAILSDVDVKKSLISDPSKFRFFCSYVGKDTINILFDDVGIDILFLYGNTDIIYTFLLVMKSFRNYDILSKLFLSNKFCLHLYNNFSFYIVGGLLDSILSIISTESLLYFLNWLKDKSLQPFYEVFSKLSSELQLDVIDSLSLSIDSTLLKRCTINTIKNILNSGNNSSVLSNFSYEDLVLAISLFNCRIPQYILEDNSFIKNIVNIFDPINYRNLMFTLEKFNYIDILEKNRELAYDDILNSYDYEFGLTSNFKNVFFDLKKLVDSDRFYDDRIYDVLKDRLNMLQGDYMYRMITDISKAYSINKDINDVLEVLRRECNLYTTNIIIDYNFKDIYYDFFLNCEQLLKFNLVVGFLSKEDEMLYSNIFNMDLLSFDEKIKLHKYLSKNDMVSKFYNDYRKTKNISLNLLKDCLVTLENVKDKKNSCLSNEHNVDIYEFKGEPFFALVKSMEFYKDFPMKSYDLNFNVDGASFSLIGNNNLMTYNDVSSYYNFVYTDFDINNVVHVFKTDSYSNYVRSVFDLATNRVFEFYTPSELLYRSIGYNEIVISQTNNLYSNELNDSLGSPKLSFLLCYNKIEDCDVETAKNLGIDILLVHKGFYKNAFNPNYDADNFDLKYYCSNTISNPMEERLEKCKVKVFK